MIYLLSSSIILMASTTMMLPFIALFMTLGQFDGAFREPSLREGVIGPLDRTFRPKASSAGMLEQPSHVILGPALTSGRHYANAWDLDHIFDSLDPGLHPIARHHQLRLNIGH
jgi:hypothetical protein